MTEKMFHEINGRKYYMGCKRDPPHKDAPLLLTREQELTLPASYIIKDLTPVGDQGNEGSCTGNAGDNVFKIRDAMVNGTFVNGARQQIYQCALAKDGNPFQDVGSSLSTIAWVLQNKGVAPESEFPYTGGMKGAVPASVLADAAKHEATKELRLDANDGSTTIANIKAAISPNSVIQSSYPVMYGYTVFESFFNTGGDGNMPAPSGGVAGGHANVFIGYDDNHTGNYDGSKGAFLSKNSWGTGFGASGYWWMPYNYFLDTNDGVGDCWAVINTSDFNPTPGPTPTPPNPTGVTFVSSPAACSWDTNRLDLFVVGSDNALWHRDRVDTDWSDWSSLAGTCTSAPAAVARTGQIIDIVVRGSDSALWHLQWTGTAWAKWTSLGGVVLKGTGPTIISKDVNSLDVFVIGTDDALYQKTLTGTTWSGWVQVSAKIK
jgi:hypothetical protein